MLFVKTGFERFNDAPLTPIVISQFNQWNLMDFSIVINLPAFCGLKDFEALLKKWYSKSKSASIQKVEFDFSILEWIGTLQTSLLYGWITEIARESPRKVSIKTGEKPSRGCGYLASFSFFTQLTRCGVSVPPILISEGASFFGFFHTFSTSNELTLYEEALLANENKSKLWPHSSDLALVKDDTLKDILLRELVDNGFIHGEGLNVRFVASEFPSDPNRKAHRILNRLDGRAYVEVVTSDSGQGILNKLTVPKGYEPDVIVSSHSLTESERTIAYAFEFSSTGDEVGRQARINNLLQGGGKDIEFVASGLWYVMRLAKKYAAQILVRTGTILVSLDCTGKKVVVESIQNQVHIPGTHIVFRCPRDSQPIAARTQMPLTTSTVRQVTAVALAGIREQTSSDAEFILRALEKIETQLAKRIGEAITVILFDGLCVDHKAFSLLVMSIGAMERRGRPLLLAGLRRELLDSAQEEWRRIHSSSWKNQSGLRHAVTHQGVGMIGEDLISFGNFGDDAQPESTTIKKHANSHVGFVISEDDALAYYEKSLVAVLEERFDKPPIRHVGDENVRYYLIEKKYYTLEFFELAKLERETATYVYAESWLSFVLQQQKVGVVFVIAEPLFGLAKNTANKLPGCKWFYATEGNDLSSFIQSILAKTRGKKLMLLTDVICRANQFQRYLSKTGSLDEIILGCLIDGRSCEEKHNYLSIDRTNQPSPVHIFSAMRHPIQTIDNLPSGVDFRSIRIVDPITHRPTSYDCLDKPHFSPNDILKYAVQSKAMFHGHFEFQGKHYQDFIFFKRLFPFITNDLYSFWQNALNDLASKCKLDKKDVAAFYLDEKRGWEQIIVEFLATSGVASYSSISRTDLTAPPDSTAPPSQSDPNKISSNKSGLWFILPAITNGETVRLCLEYGRRLTPDFIYVSIILGRLDSARLSFYQNITQYDGIPVTIAVLGHLPLPAAPSASSCSICEIEAHIDRLAARVNNRMELSRVLSERRKKYHLAEITLQSLEKKEATAISETQMERILLRTLIEQAPRNFESRKELTTLLDTMGSNGLHQLIEVVGEDFLSPRLSAETVERVIYTRFDHSREYAANLFATPTSVETEVLITLDLLLGCERLFPNVLPSYFKQILTQAVNHKNQRLVEDMVFCALLNPEKYAMALSDGMSDGVRGELGCRLLADIRDHTWSALDSDSLVEAFVDLFDFLQRSTEWGTTIDILKKSLQAEAMHRSNQGVANTELSEHHFYEINSFFIKGIEPLDGYLSKLQSSGGRQSVCLWQAIQIENPNIEGVVDTMHRTRGDLQSILRTHTATIDDALRLIIDIQYAGGELKRCLERLYTNPIDVKFDIEEIRRNAVWASENFDVIFEISSNQPGLLIGRDDLRKCIFHVVDNVDARVIELIQDEPTSKYRVEFIFGGITQDGKASEMLIRSNIPWDKDLIPSGGMKEFAKICKRYGAVYELDVKDEEGEHQYIRVIFRIMEAKVRHGH